MRKFFMTAATFAAVYIQTIPADAVEDFSPQIQSSIQNYIRPAFAAFADKSTLLPPAVSNLCSQPDAASREDFAKAYAELLTAFGGVSFLRFGPLIADHRLDSLAFMPDPRGITQRQIRKAFAADDGTLTDPARLQGKSVALQGLTALQLIAFDKNGEVVLGAPGKRHDLLCGYARAIAQNVERIAKEISKDWQDPDGYSQKLLQPEPDAQIRTSKEAVETIFNSLVTGLIVVKDQELLPTLGKEQAKARGNRFPFSRSHNGRAYMLAELKGIQAALKSAEFGGLLAEEYEWIISSLDFEFANAEKNLSSLEQPIRHSIKDPAVYGKLNLMTITINSLRDTMALELAGALGLSGGFNALDGD